jgi:hypothetical protein
MKITTEQIKQMIVEELRSLMEQEKSYDELLDELVAEIKQRKLSYVRLSPLFGDIWKVLMKKHVQSAVPNMMPYVIEKVIGNWTDLAKKPGDPEWNAEEAVGELELYLETAVDALEEFKSADTSHYNFMDDFSSAFRKEHFGGFGYSSIFGKLIGDVNKRLPENKMVKDIPVTLYMDGWRKYLVDLVPEYYDFMRAIVEVVPMAIEEPEGMLADLLLSGNPDSVIQALELFGAL